jgi:ferritin-like metal-binding protein YciE
VKIGEDRVCPIDIIVEEAERCLEENYSSPLLDAAIIAFVQQIEHVEIAIYGTLKEYADQLDESSIKKAVSQTLREEAKTDTLLTRLAMGGFFKESINVRATG